MGWNSGGELFDKIIDSLLKNVPDLSDREAIYRDLIEAFEDMDCDVLPECKGVDKAFDAAYEDIGFHNYDEDEEEDEE